MWNNAHRWVVVAGLILTACGTNDVDEQLSTDLTPTQTGDYYVDQANRYFDALDETADPNNLPKYSELVARWEWPPWLYLTGFGQEQMEALDEAVKVLTPATVGARDCRFFPVQPFARCRVSFEYAEGGCPIYEEFTFNDQGEMTFIEAWSDLPGLLPMADPNDLWAEGDGVHRMSTKLPGLGNANGLIDVDSAAMKQAADRDPEIADFLIRAEYFWPEWFEEYDLAGDDLFQRGCGWPAPAP